MEFEFFFFLKTSYELILSYSYSGKKGPNQSLNLVRHKLWIKSADSSPLIIFIAIKTIGLKIVFKWII